MKLHKKYEGMDKHSYRVKSAEGSVSDVHYVKDPKTGNMYDFKFESHRVAGK